ncbi:MAG: hypothetical protein ACLTG4_05715 [Oscillospiraceae bacterium]
MLDRPDAAMRLDKWLLAHFAGLSPLIARELSFRFAGETDAPIPTLDAARLAAFLTAEFAALPPVQMQPMLLWKDGAPTDFTIAISGNTAAIAPSRRELFRPAHAFTPRRTTPSACGRGRRRCARPFRTCERTRRSRELAAGARPRTTAKAAPSGRHVTANLHAITRGQTLLRRVFMMRICASEIPKPNLSPQKKPRGSTDYARAKHVEQVLTCDRAGEIERPIWAACSRSWPAPNRARSGEIQGLEAGGYVRPADRRKQVVGSPQS